MKLKQNEKFIQNKKEEIKENRKYVECSNERLLYRK